MEREIARILLGSTFRRMIQRVIVLSLPVRPDAGDGVGRQKVFPGSNAALPPPLFGSLAHAGQKTKGRLNHGGQP